jgi:hypothetical protein
MQMHPGPPLKNAWGLPNIPLPDVVHHPISKQVQGGRTTSSGLGVKVGGDGAIAFKDPAAAQLAPLGARFDLNDVTERLAGNDPYAREKRQIAEATFEDRLCLAEEAAWRRKQEGMYYLKERLERLLVTPGLTSARRREIVFDMWDECVDDHADGQPNLGAAARAGIIAFIRRAFPAGSADAYTPAEIASLNERRVSRSPFDPYATARAPDAGVR